TVTVSATHPGAAGASMSATATGRSGSGWLDVAYGAEVHLYGKIDTSILGQSIHWEGEIPIPHLPSDLLLGGTVAFDPQLGTDGEAHVGCQTDPVKILSTHVLSSVIRI